MPRFDQVAHVPADLPLRFSEWLLPHFIEGTVPPHGVIQPGDMHEAIAVGPGHPRIDQGNDLASMVDGGACRIDAGTQGAIAVLVRGRDLNERYVDGPGPAWR